MNIKTTNIIILFIILYINFNFVSSTKTINNYNKKTLPPQLNEYFNYHNYSYIQQNLINEPNKIYFMVKYSDNNFILGSNKIKRDSVAILENNLLGVSLNLTDYPPEILTSKTNTGLLLSGSFENTQITKCGEGCLEYYDIFNVSNNNNIYHMSMLYYSSNPDDGSLKSNYMITGMSYISKEQQQNQTSFFSMVIGNQFDSSEQPKLFGKKITHYQTNIEINPLDINSFKYVHDKSNNIYYSLIKSSIIFNGTNELYLVIFDVGNKTIETKKVVHFDGQMLDFKFVGLGVSKDKLFILVSSRYSYIYVFDLNTLFFDFHWDLQASYIDFFVKSENSRYLPCYSSRDQTLVFIDLKFKITQTFPISFQIPNHSFDNSNILHMYATFQDDEPKAEQVVHIKSSFWLFSVIFFPIVSFIVIVVAVVFVVKLIFKRNQTKKFNDLQKVEKQITTNEQKHQEVGGASNV